MNVFKIGGGTSTTAESTGIGDRRDYGIHWCCFRRAMSSAPNPGGWQSNQPDGPCSDLHTAGL
ncbi:MAG: hypothetical protein CM15mP84_10500 [Cellvibrionales bacterium]|nr:MAG: hypothetical protein CM15mP84_10500 [Cellvibrionales bacterium]